MIRDATQAMTSDQHLAFQLKLMFLGKLNDAMYRDEHKWCTSRVAYPADCRTLNEMIMWRSMIIDPRHSAKFYRLCYQVKARRGTPRGDRLYRLLRNARRKMKKQLEYRYHPHEPPPSRNPGLRMRFRYGPVHASSTGDLGWDDVVRAYEEVGQ